MAGKPKTGTARTAPDGGRGVRARKQERMLAVLEQFRRVFKSIRTHYRDVERRTGVSGAQLWALAHVSAHPGAKVGDLARALAIHASTASNLVGRLQALELITRSRVRSDQRSVLLYPTPRGMQTLERAPRPLIGVLQQGLAALSPRDLNALHESLETLIRAMKIKDDTARTTPISEM